MMGPKRSLAGVICLLAWASHQLMVTTTLGEEVVAGAVLGPGFSLVCSPPAFAALRGPPPPSRDGGGVRTAAAATGSDSSSAGSADGSESSLQRIDSSIASSKGPNTNLTSFTFCAFVKMSKSRLRSPLFTYVGRNWTVALDMTRLGVALRVQETAPGAVLSYFFEAKFPPDVWRHLCVQFDHLKRQAVCFVDDASEPLSADFEVTEGGEASGASDKNDLVLEDGGNAEWITADELSSTRSSDRPGVGKDQAPQPVMIGEMCVGGGHRGTLEAEVARAALWRMTFGKDVLSQASGCRGSLAMEDPYMAMGPLWLAAGNVTLGPYRLDEVCRSLMWVVVVRPARSYAFHVMVCQALGGRLMTSEGLTSEVMVLARGTNDSCVGSGGLVTWLLGGKEGRGATTQITAEDECPAQGTDGGISAACVRQLKCSLCQLPSTVMYTLYGHDGRLFDYNFYIDVVSGELIFRGLGGSEIVRVGNGWVLRSVLHQMEWVLGEAAVPVGRQWWLGGPDKVLLALTTCRTTQFTCDTGQCVPLTSRCDDIVQCSDRSDETNCRVIDRLSGYDPYYPPPPRPREEKPMNLFYHVDVYSMDDMTTEGGKATMNVGMTLTWFDSRLKFLNLKPEVKNYFPCELVWTPSVRAVSGHGEGTVLETSNYEKFCYAYADENTHRPLHDPFMSHQADGSTHAIYNYVGVVASVPCHFQLQMYPFDFQLCNISFMLMNAPWTRVFNKSQKGERVPYLDSRRVLLEYELKDLTTEVGWFLQGTDNNTYFVLTFHLSRLYGYHVVNSFFPSLLMFFIAYGTLFFQLEDFENRIMVSLTAQLVLAALFTSTTQSSVKTPYLKLIDVWYASIITFCFVIVIIQTVINVIFNSIRLPPFVLWVVGLRSLQLPGDKTLVTSLRVEGNKTGQQQQPSGEEVAGRYNTMFGVVILLVVLTFVVFYSMMAMRLL
nr:uncharacterized protein LOC123761881 [Procambarus clarkii]